MLFKQTFDHKFLKSKQSTSKTNFEYYAPQAHSVFLAGTFNDWNTEACPLKKSQEGRWKVSFPLQTGRHEYLFYVDGLWECDPNARECVPNPFGSWNCVLTIS